MSPIPSVSVTTTWAILLTSILTLINATPIDNKIEANTLEVKCLADGIQVSFQTWKSFTGHVYVKGQFSQPQCHSDFTNVATGDTKVAFIVPFQGCNAKRERSLSPKGVYFTSTVVAQFHHLFITKVDRAYSLQCFYMEATKTLTQGLDVSMLPISELLVTREMPICTYTVHTGSIDGPYARFAKVGDPIYHKWQCPGDVYGILVHSCNAKDGSGAEYELIDKHGCSVDPVIVGDLTYSSSLNMASVEVHAFKFADKLQVSFQCQVTLCLKADLSCRDVTPPTCTHSGYIHPSTKSSYDYATVRYPVGPYGAAQNVTTKNPYQAVASPPSASPPNNYGTTVVGSNPYKLDPAGLNLPGERQKRNDRSRVDKSKLAETLDLTSEELLVFNTDDSIPEPNFLKVDVVGAKQLCFNVSSVAQISAGTFALFLFSIVATIICQRRYLYSRKNQRSKITPTPNTESQLHY